MVTEHFCTAGIGRLRFGAFGLLPLLTVAVVLSGAVRRGEAVAAPAEAAAAPARQNYEELPVDETLKRNSMTISGTLLAGKFTPGQEQSFDDYYQKYSLARWTQVKNLANLPAWRKSLRNSDLGKKSAAPQVHDHLNALVLEFMKKLAAGPYHPAVRVNAMLMIGELNSVEQPPTPLPEALDVLIAAMQDMKLPDVVRVAALVGIQRHVALGIADTEIRRTLTAALLKVAAQDLPAGADRAGREWIRCLCLDALGHLGSPGENNAAFNAMANAVADSKLRFSTRATAAESLGRLDYAGATGINATETAAAIAQFIIDVCVRELPKAKEGDVAAGRQLHGRLQQCSTAALTALGGDAANRKGLLSAAPAAQQSLLGELQQTIGKMVEQLGKWHEGDNLEKPVVQLQNDLENWLKRKPK